MSGSDKPEWWKRNEQLKRALDIPEYEPPRFTDETYVHSVVDDLESEFECSIRFVGYDTNYPEDWALLVDGELVDEVSRWRDSSGNTVYDLDVAEFRSLVRSHFEASSTENR